MNLFKKIKFILFGIKAYSKNSTGYLYKNEYYKVKGTLQKDDMIYTK